MFLKPQFKVLTAFMFHLGIALNISTLFLYRSAVLLSENTDKEIRRV